MNDQSTNHQTQIAHFIQDAELGSLPPATRAAAARQMLDTVAVGWAGSDADGVRQAADLAIEEGAAPAVPLWGRQERVSSLQAAFVNGASAAALDYDSVHQESLLHPAAITVPTALALAAETGANGRETLDAHIVGSEVMCRISLATPRQSNWFPPSVYGIFGATATAARLLNLSTAQTLNALGLALAQASGTKQAITERTLTKRLQTAFVARAGILAAKLALRGVTGPHDFLEGSAGLFAVIEGGDAGKAVDGLGERMVFQDAVIKKYPTCLCTHVVIEAADKIRKEHGIGVIDIKQIDTMITAYMARLIGGAYAPGSDPQVSAQFSAAYATACTFLRGGITLGDIEPAAATAPDILDTTAKVSVGIFDDIDGHVAPARVTVTCTDGRTFSADVAEVPSAAGRGASDEAIYQKSMDCLTRGHGPLTEKDARALISRILGIDDLVTLRDLFDFQPQTET